MHRRAVISTGNTRLIVACRPNVHARRSLVTTRAQSTQASEKIVERRKLGDVEVSTMGVGAWSWGDRSGYWGYNKTYGKDDNQSAYQALLNTDIDFVDTAEVYGFGKSEEFLGEFMRDSNTKLHIATKFGPLPFRFTANSLVSACRGSLQRLGVDKVALYMQHWPGFFFNAFSNDAYIEGLARCYEQGLCDAVGVSNFREDRVRSAARQLKARGTNLASNQVQYSLLYRAPESNGVLEACQENGTTLVAYSPLCQGLLSGKYTTENKPGGQRSLQINDDRIRAIQPLLGLMREIGAANGGKTPTQVAINWTMCKGALPIPGVKNAKQVEEVAGALGWRLSSEQVADLDRASSKIPRSTGAPFENW